MSHKPFNPIHLLSVLSVLTTAIANIAWVAPPLPIAEDTETVVEGSETFTRGMRRRRGTVADDCQLFVDLRESAWG